MNLFELLVKIGIDDQATKQISSITKTLGKGVVNASKIAVKSITAVSAAVGSLATMSIKQYSEYEQLIGGVDTLFKASSQKVQQYAAEAYRTAGMSANDYMATVTSFSASLLQSLGNDTNAAAEYANQALIDMSDNANKMGTSLDSIVQTYQSLSRGNFAMLDNLKLGYGGSKAELQRLIADASKLSDTVDAQSMSFANIVEAIHVVQTEMGITGTTAKEAASTIQGSVGMMKAAWQNLMVSIADENSDLEKSVEEFSKSVIIAFENIVPKVEVALTSILDVAEQVLPDLSKLLIDTINNLVPKVIKTASSLIKQIAQTMESNAPEIVQAAKEIVFTFIDGVVDALPYVIDAINEIVGEIVEIIPELIAKIAGAFLDVVEIIVEGIGKGTIKIGKAIASWFVDLPDAADKAVENLNRALANFKSFSDLVDEAASKQVDLSKSLSDAGKTISEIDDNISRAESNITKILSNALKTQQGLRDSDIKKIKEYNEELRTLEEEKLSIYRGQQLAELRKAQFGIGTAQTPEELAKYVVQAESALDAANAAVEEIYSNRIIAVENYYKSIGEIGSDAHNKELAELEKQRQSELAINKKYYSDSISLVNQQSTVLAKSALDSFSDLKKQSQLFETVFKSLEDSWYFLYDPEDFFSANEDLLRISEDVDKMYSNYINGLAKIDKESANAFLTSTLEAKKNGVVLSEETKKTVDQILSSFQDMPGTLGEKTQETLLTVIDGLEEYIPELKNASDMSVSEITDLINEYFGIEAGSETGKDYGSALASGLNDSAPDVKEAVDNLIGQLPDGVNIDVSTSSSGQVDGSHANGLSYVPRDGYIAKLHKGERVLTYTEARRYGESLTGDINITINGAQYKDERKLATAIAQEIQAIKDRRAAARA